MPYEFPEDYEQLQDDFFAYKHMKDAGPGNTQTSFTLPKTLYNRVKMISKLEEVSLGQALTMVTVLGCTAYEQSLKEAKERAEMQEYVDKLSTND